MNYIAIVRTPEGGVEEVEIFACNRPTDSIMALLCRQTFGCGALSWKILTPKEYSDLAF